MLKNSKILFVGLFLLAFSANATSITATNWLVADGAGNIIQSARADEPRSIASITKLMTAMVVLDAKQDMTQRISGVTRQQLLELMLVHSDNHAAETLCQAYPTAREGCIAAMNAKATSLGLKQTSYADPTGLDSANISTARELVQVALEAANYQEIVEIAHEDRVKIKKKRKTYVYANTNPLIKHYDFLVSKTGFTHAAGGCILMMLNTKIGQRIVVLLNSKNTHTRIPEAEFIANNY